VVIVAAISNIEIYPVGSKMMMDVPIVNSLD
jgi:hypothetical protein